MNAFAPGHVDRSAESDARGSTVPKLPNEDSRHGAGPEVQLSLKLFDGRNGQVQLFVVNQYPQPQRMRTVDHEAQAIGHPSVAGDVREVLLVKAVEIGALESCA